MTPPRAPRGPMRRAFDRAYARTDRDQRAVAVVDLARAYADALDAAGELAAAALVCARSLAQGGEEDRAAAARKLAKALDARLALADLGPKYLAALQALHLTAAARAALNTNGGPGEPDPAERALMDRRERARKRNAPALDAAATPPDA
jgi:hypothetical protein